MVQISYSWQLLHPIVMFLYGVMRHPTCTLRSWSWYRSFGHLFASVTAIVSAFVAREGKESWWPLAAVCGAGVAIACIVWMITRCCGARPTAQQQRGSKI